MNTLCQAVDDYLELRRGLGFKLVKYGACLREFVSFLEQKRTSHITTALALQFAMLHPQQEPKAQASRYSAVRGFASYRSSRPGAQVRSWFSSENHRGHSALQARRANTLEHAQNGQGAGSPSQHCGANLAGARTQTSPTKDLQTLT